jgi:hypothetical protein
MGMDFADFLVLLVHVAYHRCVKLAVKKRGIARHKEPATALPNAICGCWVGPCDHACRVRHQ